MNLRDVLTKDPDSLTEYLTRDLEPCKCCGQSETFFPLQDGLCVLCRRDLEDWYAEQQARQAESDDLSDWESGRGSR